MNHIIQGSLVTSLENVFKIIFEMQDVKNKSEVFCAFIMLISWLEEQIWWRAFSYQSRILL